MFKTYNDEKYGNPSAGRPVGVTGSSRGVVQRREAAPASKAPRTSGNYGFSRTANAGGSPVNSGSGGSFGSDRYNPAFDRLDEGSVVEDWIPRDQPGIHKMLRQIYLRDEVGGPMVDIYKEMAWSDFDLQGLKDKRMLAVYEECSAAMDFLSVLPDVSSEVLIIGRSINSLIWDDARGIFTGMVPHDPDFCKITPMPIHGHDPLVDLRASPAWKAFVDSDDERVTAIKSTLPPRILETLSNSGFVPLDPVSTVFMRRRANAYDHIGTSLYTRLINFIAIQKALLDSTVVALRRRAAGVLHIIAGNERWEPTEEELNSLAGMWMQAEEDQGGGIVATRDGIQTERGQSAASDLWKLSDEWSFLSEGKMRALGISDAFLAGDATFSNMEMALSVFLERLRGFRAHVTHQFLIQRVFNTIARAHGFIKPEKNSPQGRRNAALMSHREALQLPSSRLWVPEIRWHKSLHPVGDESYLSILDRMKEAGLPVTMEHYAAAGGFDLKRAMTMLDDDMSRREQLRDWMAATGEGMEEDMDDDGGGGGSIFGKYVPHPIRTQTDSVREMRQAAPRALANLPVWDRTDRFMGLEKSKAQRALKRVMPRLLREGARPPMRQVVAASGLSGRERAAFRYLLTRSGLAPTYTMAEKTQGAVTEHLFKRLDKRTAIEEVQVLARATNNKRARAASAERAKTGKRDKLPLGPTGLDLLSGYTG